VVVLQQDLPVVDEPFAELAAQAHMSQEELLDHARRLLRSGVMRRFASVLGHRRAGYVSNAMVCWNVGADRLDEIGLRLSTDPKISHCYSRPAFPDWPYSLYTMIHCHDENELAATIERLARLSGVSDYRALRTIREYKKSRPVYLGEGRC
jgi:DNA-binding Lrp family transcriptional regulator